MKTWQLQDAKAHFSEMVETCLTDGPQMVTKRGTEVVVMVPVEQWRRMDSTPKFNLKEWLLAPEPRVDELVPARKPIKMRKLPEFD